MTLADDVNLEEFVMTKDEFSGADIKAICTEAGLLALRERRMKVSLNTLSCNLFGVTFLFLFVSCVLKVQSMCWLISLAMLNYTLFE